MISFKIARKNAGLTQEDIAKLLGVSQSAVSQWERGIASPGIARIHALSGILSIPVEQLVSVCIGGCR